MADVPIAREEVADYTKKKGWQIYQDDEGRLFARPPGEGKRGGSISNLGGMSTAARDLVNNFTRLKSGDTAPAKSGELAIGRSGQYAAPKRGSLAPPKSGSIAGREERIKGEARRLHVMDPEEEDYIPSERLAKELGILGLAPAKENPFLEYEGKSDDRGDLYSDPFGEMQEFDRPEGGVKFGEKDWTPGLRREPAETIPYWYDEEEDKLHTRQSYDDEPEDQPF